MKLKNTLVFIISLFLIFILCGCSEASNQSNTEADKPVIAVSIVPQATFAEKVCKDKFEIITVIPSGASPETYEPSPQDTARLEVADIYFSIGVPAEDGILETVSENTQITELHTAVSAVYPDLSDHDHGGRDPHIWLSPKRASVMVNTIAEMLCTYDPENAVFYKSNAESYIKELESLDGEIKTLLSDKQNRKFIAFHPAFGYFADDYGLSMYALEEHGKEATAKRIAEMTDLAKKENIKVIFYQAETSGRQAQAFAEEIGGKAISLEPLAADYVNNLKEMAQALYEAMK